MWGCFRAEPTPAWGSLREPAAKDFGLLGPGKTAGRLRAGPGCGLRQGRATSYNRRFLGLSGVRRSATRPEFPTMTYDSGFFNLYRHNFARVAVAVPVVRVADPAHNAAQTVALLEQAAARQAVLAVFPELGLSAYTCEDLFHQQALLDASLGGLGRVVDASRGVPVVAVVGVPLKVDHMLFNCAVVVYRGRLLGVAPKTYLPNYREFYELRQFAPADAARSAEIDLLGQRVPFGNRLLFQAANHPLFTVYAEICEDLWVPVPPSSYAALAGATLMANLSASNITIGKDEYRRSLAASQSARCLSAYLYSAAGQGESTTDLAWDGQGLIYENGTRVAETRRFQTEAQLVAGDIDLDRLSQDRMRQTTFSDSSRRHREELAKFRVVSFELELPAGTIPLVRTYERFPYVPSDASRRDERCEEVYRIQVQGLATRLHAAGTRKIVIGISGGLDSTQALVVCAKAMDQMGLPRSNILGYTMPAFATSERTLDQARRLMAAVGCSAAEIDIRPSCLQMLKDIGHPFVDGHPVFDITFENVQAGERTSHLFRLANQHGGVVVGTSDLSELALGWCTYGVGDHMAHYHVNASVPKTLIQYLIRWAADTEELGAGCECRPARGARHRDQPRARTRRGGRTTRATHGGRGGALRAAGLQPLLHAAAGLPAVQGGVPVVERLARPDGRCLAGYSGSGAARVRHRGDQALARCVPQALFRAEPVQAELHREQPEGGLRRIALASRRLAGAERRGGGAVAGGSRRGAGARPRVTRLAWRR